MKSCFIVVAAMIVIVLLNTSFNLAPELVAQSIAIDQDWYLTVTGLVDNSLNLTLTDLIAMPKNTIYAQIYCVGPPGFLVEEGNWTGVRLGLILDKAGIASNAIKVAFYASDGFSTDLTIESAKIDNVMVAYGKDGSPLNETLRLVVPGRWGYKWIYHLTRIELVDYDFLGKYESQGYSDSAETTSSGAPGYGGTSLPSEIFSNRNDSAPQEPPPSSPDNQSPNSTDSTPETKPDEENPENPEKPTLSPIDLIAIAAVVVASVLIASIGLIFYILKIRKRSLKESDKILVRNTISK